MNKDEEADADDLASEVETDRTRQKIRRGLGKFRRRLQDRVQLLLGGHPCKNQTRMKFLWQGSKTQIVSIFAHK